MDFLVEFFSVMQNDVRGPSIDAKYFWNIDDWIPVFGVNLLQVESFWASLNCFISDIVNN